MLGLVLLAAMLVAIALWVMPGALFAHPGANDAIQLSALGPLVFLITLVVTVLFPLVMRRLGRGTVGSVGVGVLVLGLLPAFGTAIVMFGNFQNDRFAPLFLSPVLAVPAGIVVLVLSVGTGSSTSRQRWQAAALGVGAAVLVTLWILGRGAAVWLLAPYGFDLYLLILLAAVSLAFLGSVRWLPWLALPLPVSPAGWTTAFKASPTPRPPIDAVCP